MIVDENILLKAENYMKESCRDSAHDAEHVYRVLNLAINIAAAEEHVNYFVLIISCLLHDIGRNKQFADPTICHAKEGGNMAYTFLIDNGIEAKTAIKIKKCIERHRYRSENQPKAIEEKILFDADKIDVAGAIGIARTLFYEGKENIPLYHLDQYGNVIAGKDDLQDSFFREYEFKLSKINKKLYTESARKIAQKRFEYVELFYNKICEEIDYNKNQIRTFLEGGMLDVINIR